MEALPSGQPNTSEGLRNAEIEIWAKTIASEQHKDRNEDSIFQILQKSAFGVFDGIGGAPAGDVASRIARDYAGESITALPDGFTLQQTKNSLMEILQEASRRILQQVSQRKFLRGMGTTASVVIIWEGPRGEKKAVIGNVGDSRVYIQSAEGSLEQITLDDGVVKQAVKDEAQARALQSKLNNAIDVSSLSLDERFLFNYRDHIFQFLGCTRLEPNVHALGINVGDRLIVTSDGIHDNLTDAEISKILAQFPNNQKAVENLTESARRRSHDKQHPRAKPDDMSAIVAEIK